MSRLAFSKASLHKQTALLKRYRQYLPSLELKQQQLMIEKNKAKQALQLTLKTLETNQQRVKEQLPMLAITSIAVEDLISIDSINIGSENHVGIDLPYLRQLTFIEKPYSYLCKPHWVDKYVIQMKQALQLRVSLHIEQKRLTALEQALKKVTQRVNLFDKVLIPRAQQNIRKIQIFLSDTERAAVVRAKMTKQKRNRSLQF